MYLDLIEVSGLADAIKQHVRVAGGQGWLDLQMIIALVMLNLAGGDGLEDLERLERDAGFVAVMREVERGLLSRAERRQMQPRGRTLPSPAAMAEWLGRFHGPQAEARRAPGTAYIPPWPLATEVVPVSRTVG